MRYFLFLVYKVVVMQCYSEMKHFEKLLFIQTLISTLIPGGQFDKFFYLQTRK